jgi:dipeptidyl aminopeptidase/acylaminoacyl peptidase
MAEREPIEFKGRDGTVLHGYLTVPPGRELKSLPLVVNPHGGPFDLRDNWFWNDDAQFLASRGLAVLQVNFRGSGGYGRAFRDGGKKGWGTVMIDDIVDATRWVIDQHYADPQRVCIYGASYGGYAAMMSAVREPGMFRCVVAYAGVYDLTDMQWYSDVGRSIYGSNYIDEYIGSSRAQLLAQSPLTYIDQLRAPLFIAHGESDYRSPLQGATKVKEMLEKRHFPVESMFKRGEGHGFWNEDNRTEFYERMGDFIQRNIGAGAAAPGDAAKPN